MAQPRPKQDKTNSKVKSPELPRHEQVASLAYALWQARDCAEGSPEEDWLKAEHELTTSD